MPFNAINFFSFVPFLFYFSGKQNIFNCYSNDSSGNYISLSVINRRDGFGQTLLHRAATEDDLDGVCAMIKAGANVNAQDYAGKYNIQHKISFIKITESILFK